MTNRILTLIVLIAFAVLVSRFMNTATLPLSEARRPNVAPDAGLAVVLTAKEIDAAKTMERPVINHRVPTVGVGVAAIAL